MARKRVAIFISGSGSNMETLIRSMAEPDHPAEPCLVLSNRSEAAGLEKARALGVATSVIDHKPFAGDRKAFEAAITEALARVSPDIICLAGFMRILTGDFVAGWEGRMLNTHPSLLPKYKGLHTHRRALEASDMVHGCSVHLVTPELDGGPVLGQARIAVKPDDTEETLAARVLAMEHKLYPAVLRSFAEGKTAKLVLT